MKPAIILAATLHDADSLARAIGLTRELWTYVRSAESLRDKPAESHVMIVHREWRRNMSTKDQFETEAMARQLGHDPSRAA